MACEVVVSPVVMRINEGSGAVGLSKGMRSGGVELLLEGVGVSKKGFSQDADPGEHDTPPTSESECGGRYTKCPFWER